MAFDSRSVWGEKLYADPFVHHLGKVLISGCLALHKKIISNPSELHAITSLTEIKSFCKDWQQNFQEYANDLEDLVFTIFIVRARPLSFIFTKDDRTMTTRLLVVSLGKSNSHASLCNSRAAFRKALNCWNVWCMVAYSFIWKTASLRSI